jgi:hypothetical protein
MTEPLVLYRESALGSKLGRRPHYFAGDSHLLIVNSLASVQTAA